MDILVYTAGTGAAAEYACEYLKACGIPMVSHPTPEITHLLLDVPSRDIPVELLERLPERLCIVGGNLDRTELEDYQKIDLLKNHEYLSRNAAITAQCALQVAMEKMHTVFTDTPALVIGWGRIGKCLASLLRGLGCGVTVAARKETDRGMLKALGYECCGVGDVPKGCRLIFNTAPELVLKETAMPKHCLKIDLASKPGLEGTDVIWARGLPGRYAPESSGALIGEIFLKEAGL